MAEIYSTHFAFVFRTMRRMGVPPAQIDDAVQDVFLVVHRRFDELQWSSSEQTLLFGIALRVAQDHRRAVRRRRENLSDNSSAMDSSEILLADPAADPAEELGKAQAKQILYHLLEKLDDEKRAILVSVELEQMPVPEVARAMNLKLNTTYTKLRGARKDFETALAQFRRNEMKGQS
jgi:RNA polymerase sigma-70 factor, ECF subfamily